MRFWPWRRRRATTSAPNATRIVLLEHALNGTEPAPGTWAATMVTMKRAGTCMRHRPIATFPNTPGARGVCEGCWRFMVMNDAGDRVIAPNP